MAQGHTDGKHIKIAVGFEHELFDIINKMAKLEGISFAAMVRLLCKETLRARDKR